MSSKLGFQFRIPDYLTAANKQLWDEFVGRGLQVRGVA